MATWTEEDQGVIDRINEATEHLKNAREILKEVDCPKTLERVRLAISSIKGARRSAYHRHFRREGR